MIIIQILNSTHLELQFIFAVRFFISYQTRENWSEPHVSTVIGIIDPIN